MRSSLSFVFALATCAIMFICPLAMSQEAPSVVAPKDVDQALFREVAGELRCPTCTGLSVLDSDATFSVQIKNEVKEQLAKGKSEKEILKFFTERYGPWILRSPPVEGVNAFAWVIPISALIVGPFLIWFFVGRGRKQQLEIPVRKTENIVAELKNKLAKIGIEEDFQ
ncbi:MAG: cytochrome c-type biogenesis protein CcmH [Proteobacteria bacterium]|nr:cytochrome c-type biogenesis protein CcmH [Pseudomonadota bacterium]